MTLLQSIPAGLLEGSSAASTGLRWLDITGLAIVGVFVLMGFIRGLWWQVIRLLGLILAVIVARVLSARWGVPFQEETGLSLGAAYGLVWFGVFIATLGAASLLGLIGKKSLEAIKLGLVDRMGGALAGAVTGLIVHVALLLGLTVIGPSDWTASALRGTYSEGLLRAVSTRWPLLTDSKLAEKIHEWLGTPQEDGSSEGQPGDEVK